MRQFTLEQITELSNALGRPVNRVNDPCFLYNGHAVTCLSRSLKIEGKFPDPDVIFWKFFDTICSDMERERSGDTYFLLSHDCAAGHDVSVGITTVYKIRYAKISLADYR